MLNHIANLTVLPDYKLLLRYEDGETVIADFLPVIQQRGIFSPLADTNFFERASLDIHGRIVFWPGELEFCADALRVQSTVREEDLNLVGSHCH